MLQEDRSRLTQGETLMSILGEAGSRAPQVGADLRAARERTGYSLPEVADGLRIRLPYLQALEEGRLADLPGSAYALGFLRTYAEALGLDAEEILRRFKAEAEGLNARTALDFPAPAPRGRLPAGAMVLLGVLLSIGAYIGWYRLSGEGRLPAETVTAVPERLAPLALQANPAPVATPSVPALGDAAGVGMVQPQEANAPAAAAPESPAPSPGQAAAAIPLPPPAPPPAALAVAPPAAVPVVAAGTEEGRIVVRARADVWVQLRGPSGQVVFDRVLKTGEAYAVPNRPGLSFTTGNAQATELLVDGQPTPGLGAVKGVRRGLALDAEMIKDGRLAAQLANGQTVTRTQ